MESTSKLIIFIFTFLALTANAYAQSPREELQQMVGQLQKTPNDNTLRERIIKLAAEIKPAPAIPEEAERRMARGAAAFKSATPGSDYQDAVKEFEQATLAAPWYGDAYFNLGVAQDKAGNYEAALRSLKLAQMASPDSKEIKALLYEVEYRGEKANAAEAEKRWRQAKADDMRKREEAKKFQRQTWAKDLARWMTENYGRSLLSKVQHCFYCTDEDARGSNWTYAEALLPPDYNDLTKDWSRLGKKLAFRTAGQANDEIIFSGVMNNGVMSHDFCGTVNGRRPEDIQWNACGGDKNLLGFGQATSAVFTTTDGGKPMVRIKSSCHPNGRCSHANLMLN